MLREWLTGLKARDRIKPYTSTKAQILVALVGCKLDWRNKQTQNIKSKQTKKEKNKKKENQKRCTDSDLEKDTPSAKSQRSK